MLKIRLHPYMFTYGLFIYFAVTYKPYILFSCKPKMFVSDSVRNFWFVSAQRKLNRSQQVDIPSVCKSVNEFGAVIWRLRCDFSPTIICTKESYKNNSSKHEDLKSCTVKWNTVELFILNNEHGCRHCKVMLYYWRFLFEGTEEICNKPKSEVPFFIWDSNRAPSKFEEGELQLQVLAQPEGW